MSTNVARTLELSTYSCCNRSRKTRPIDIRSISERTLIDVFLIRVGEITSVDRERHLASAPLPKGAADACIERDERRGSFQPIGVDHPGVVRHGHRSRVAQSSKEIRNVVRIPRDGQIAVSPRASEELAAAKVGLRRVEPRALLHDPTLQNEVISDAPAEIDFHAGDARATEVCLDEFDGIGS